MLSSTEVYANAGPSASFITTVKGGRFYFDQPRFDIEEIAHALGMQCRFTGHCRKFYSVAEHSLLVSLLMERLHLGDPFEGLMHDAQEAYFMDLASPWKAMIPEYKALEKKLERLMRINYGLYPVPSDGCKTADYIALAIEARQLMADKGSSFLYPPGILEEANRWKHLHLSGYEPEVARDHFLAAFGEMGSPRGYNR